MIHTLIYSESLYHLRELWLRGGCQGSRLLLKHCLSKQQWWLLPPQPGSVPGEGRLCIPWPSLLFGRGHPTFRAVPWHRVRQASVCSAGLGRMCRQLPVGCPAATRTDFSWRILWVTSWDYLSFPTPYICTNSCKRKKKNLTGLSCSL